MTRIRSKARPALELLHQVLPHGPHARPLAVDVHRDRRQQTRHLDASNGDEHLLRAVGLEPAVEEEGEDQAVEDVCASVSVSLTGREGRGWGERSKRGAYSSRSLRLRGLRLHTAYSCPPQT